MSVEKSVPLWLLAHSEQIDQLERLKKLESLPKVRKLVVSLVDVQPFGRDDFCHEPLLLVGLCRNRRLGESHLHHSRRHRQAVIQQASPDVVDEVATLVKVA